MKRFFIFLSYLLYTTLLFAQPDGVISVVNITTLSDTSIAVEVKIPEDYEKCMYNSKITYRIAGNIKGYYRDINPTERMEDVGLYSGDSLLTLFDGPNEIDYFQNNYVYTSEKIAADNLSLRYIVKSSYGKEGVFPPISSVFHPSLSLYNWEWIIGRLSFYQWQCHIYIDGEDTGIGVNTAATLWQKRPRVIGSRSFLLDSIPIYIFQSPYKEKELNQWIKEAISATSSFNIDLTDKELVFLFDTMGTQSGAIARDSMLIFYFDKKDLLLGDKYLVQKTIIHELLHWHLDEINYYSQDKYRWQDEAIPEYLALYLLLKNKLISDDLFLAKMEEKTRLSDKFIDKSLSEMSDSLDFYPEYYAGYYSKGVVALWIKDLTIQASSNFEFDISNTYNRYKRHYYSKNIDSLFFPYFMENQSILYNEYINNFGIIYEYQKNNIYYPTAAILLNEESIITENGGFSSLQIGDEIKIYQWKKESARCVEIIGKPNKQEFAHNSKKR